MKLFSNTQFAYDAFERYLKYYISQKFYWTTKKKDNYGNVMHLKRDPSGSIERVPYAFHSESERLTEPEVIAEGYNPNFYMKEEVE